jgi:signal transduction histidine kinase
MRGLLVIVVVTLAAVILTFLYTLVTLQRQKKLSELKDDFINNITHEFKTPLSVISVAASSLKQDKIQASPQKITEISTVLDKQNKLLSRMIDNVIDVNLLNRRVANYNKESVLLKPYLSEVVTMFVQNDTSGKNIQINEDYQIPDDFRFLLDSVQFSRVLNNLLGNSVKYCAVNPVITIRAMVDGPLKIEIEDNGIGIKEEHLKDVFNKFFRVDTSTKVKGLGLGLYIVKRIIESHSGTISLKSTLGKGTTATIILPK